jgi:hypothetical protein
MPLVSTFGAGSLSGFNARGGVARGVFATLEYIVVAGGGGGASGVGQTAGAGGSGIVIFRYLDTVRAVTSTTGSPTVITIGGYRYYKFTGSGSITF